MFPDNALASFTQPNDTGIEIIHVDDDIIIANKSSGLLSVPGRGAGKQDCMASRVQALYSDALVVHRLDMSTSGLMLMARGSQAQRQLSIAFQKQEVHKLYVAVVDGHLTCPKGTIDLPLICDWPNRPRRIVDLENGKPSTTSYTVLQYNSNGTTRVALEPLTGRSHQLRVHMQSLGHAILGDALYANEVVRKKSERLLLHAQSLSFEHPSTLQRVSFFNEASF